MIQSLDYTLSELDTVKRVIFGNQNLIGSIDDSACLILADGISQIYGKSCLNNPQDFRMACNNFLNSQIANFDESKSNLIILLGGIDSLNLLKNPGPKTVASVSAGENSDKMLFKVITLGEMFVLPDREKDVTQETPEDVKGVEKVKNDSVYDIARSLCSEICKVAPDGLKQELQDDCKVALYCAPYYYQNEKKIRSGELSKLPENMYEPVIKDINKAKDDIKVKIKELYLENKSFKEIASITNTDVKVVKAVLKELGYDVR